MKKISIREALGIGWKKFMERPGYLFVFALAFTLLFAVAGASNSVVTALACIVYGGYIVVMIRHYRGERIVFDDLFTIDSRWISFAFVILIKMLFILLGLVLFIIPGIYLAIKWAFAEMLVLDKGMRPMEALRASSAMTKGHRWKLFFFGVATSIVMLVGFVALILGAVVASIVIMFAFIKLYEDLKT